jgi:hypothetical protein
VIIIIGDLNCASSSFFQQWQKESDAMKKHCENREAEIMRIPGSDERWANWVQFTAARMGPTFTEKGFHLVDLPLHVRSKLEAALNAGLKDWDR